MSTKLARMIVNGEWKVGSLEIQGVLGGKFDIEDLRYQLNSMPCIDIQPVMECDDDIVFIPPSELPSVAPPFEKFWTEMHVDDEEGNGGRAYCGVYWSKCLTVPGERGWKVIGNILVGRDGRFAQSGIVMMSMDENGAVRGFEGDVDNIMSPHLFAIALMHCKNVSLRENALTEKQRRSLAKKGRRKELVRWHVLEIEPMKQVLRTEGKSESLGLKQALHICRGHFKDYRQSGLFGKVKGIFWWDSTVRGSSKEGVVVKDYSVKAPGPSVPPSVPNEK